MSLKLSKFWLQAVEKLLLAEGTKIAMTKVQSAYDQGVYGLVVNLGSIAARLLLQPFEEAAFMSFSQPLPEEGRVEQQLGNLIPLVRIALLFGAPSEAFSEVLFLAAWSTLPFPLITRLRLISAARLTV